MSLLQTIKDAQLAARKARKSVEAAALTTLIGEALAKGKESNREPNDAEVIATLRKFAKNAHEMNRIAGDYRDSERADQAWLEIQLYESFLPKQLTEEELRVAIGHIILDRALGVPGELPKMGTVMQDLKAKHEGNYDAQLASKLVKEALQPGAKLSQFGV